MTEANPLSALLACPRCDKAPLEHGESGHRCAACNVEFPSLDGIPFLFAEPRAARAEWRGRMHLTLRHLEQQCQSLDAALGRREQRALTRRRLEALREATADHSRRLRALLAPLDVDSATAGYETYLALKTRLPSDQGLTTYYGNVHRDWCWGRDENEASLEIVAEALGSRTPGRTLVLGAGAGRLAYDLHMRLGGDPTVVLDFNPLLLLIAQRVTRGEAVELYEFPLAPKSVEEQAVLRALSAEAPARPGLEHVLADAHRPPFAKASFDTVVTPWLVDILPEPLDTLAARVNRLLADGGRWINFGSLSFHDSDPALRYGAAECAEVLVENGFGPPDLRERSIPYLCSPASRHGRREQVLRWGADKVRSVAAPPRHQALPDWLVRGNEPVPLPQGFRTQIMTTRIHAFIMSLIDGRRSLKDIAAVLAEQKLMAADDAEHALRSFLSKMLDDETRHTPY